MAAGHGTWWRLADTLGANGELAGRTLYAGRAAKTTLAMALGAESMARGPVAGLLVVTTDDGRQWRRRRDIAPDLPSVLDYTTLIEDTRFLPYHRN